MTLLCAWLPREPNPGSSGALATMGAALRTGDAQEWGAWGAGALEVGLWDLREAEPTRRRYDPAVSEDGRHWLWLAGEAFSFDGAIALDSAERSRDLEFRRELLDLLLRDGSDAVGRLNGHFQALLWDSRERELTVLNDRFGAVPGYWAESPEGFAFAGGVRGVMAAPGVSREPDPEALIESATFGGFRLGDRTNIKGVKMLPGGAALRVREGRASLRRYWGWKEIAPVADAPMEAHIERLDQLWRRSMRRVMSGAQRPGQTLSGGLDSRAILAEGRGLAPSWTAITYGVPRCDDARYAQRAAAEAGAEWLFYSLYDDPKPDWLEARSRLIHETDGLIELGDLMHAETGAFQAERIDLHVSGYIGDAVVGPTFTEAETLDNVLQRMPFYGPEIGLNLDQARERMAGPIAELGGAPVRFALFEHKLPQSTNRWGAAWHTRFRVRRPYIDYDLFDFCQGLPISARRERGLQRRWLLERYPRLFRSIPNQKTGLPIGASAWKVQAERGRRFLWRKIQPALAGAGLPARPRVRAYRAEEERMREPAARARIEGTILRPGSFACDVFGRERLSAFVRRWFELGDAATQIIGALYTFEAWLGGVAGRLEAARQEGESARRPAGVAVSPGPGYTLARDSEG